MMRRLTTPGGEDWLYVYTADDERIWMYDLVHGKSRYALRDLSGKVLREYTVVSDIWTLERDYIYAQGQLFAAETPQGLRHFYPDHLGTPRLVTDAAGAQKAFHVYYPFGEEATATDQDQERMKFTGHERDLADPSGTGDDLDYMHARHCSFLTGKMLSADPSAASVAMNAPQSWNRYAYAFSNPLKFVDPTGAIVVFADQESQRVYAKYKNSLNTQSQDYQNLLTLENSNITYRINVEDQGQGNEGSVSYDGNEVSLNVDPAGAQDLASINSRLAHEIQHGVQVDSGMIGFYKAGNEWQVRFADIQDEVGAWDAQLRQAAPNDLFRGNLRGYSRAKDKADYLIRHGYGQYRGRKNAVSNSPHVPGYAPGSILRNPTWFYRIR